MSNPKHEPVSEDTVVTLGKEFSKPPLRILGFTFCKHVWKQYWHSVDESTQVQLERCARCLKDKQKWKSAL